MSNVFRLRPKVEANPVFVALDELFGCHQAETIRDRQEAAKTASTSENHTSGSR